MLNKTINCCIIGDSKVGKTCLIESYTSSSFPRIYKPTILDVYSAIVNVGNDSITLRLFDFSGSKTVSNYRKQLLSVCDVAILCYSLLDPTSLKSIKKFWVNEIKQASSAPLVLVGTHADLYQPDQNENKLNLKADEFALKAGIKKSLACSALTQENLKEVFDSAILLDLEKDEGQGNLNKDKCCLF